MKEGYNKSATKRLLDHIAEAHAKQYAKPPKKPEPEKRLSLYDYVLNRDPNIDVREPSALLWLISNYLEENLK